MMRKGTSVPSSEAPSSSPSPVASSPSVVASPLPRAQVLAEGETKKAGPEDPEGWRKPSKVARHSVKGKDPVVCCGSAGSSGPLALVPALMEVVAAAGEVVDRPMADRDEQLLKRARSPSPDQPCNDRQLVVRPAGGESQLRRSKQATRDAPLLLLPAPSSEVAEVSVSDPCMSASLVVPSGDQDRKALVEGGVLVNVPVKTVGLGTGGNRRGSGSRGKAKVGMKTGNRVAKGERQGKEGAGSGGPIRREKPKREGLLSRGEGPGRSGKKPVGGKEGGGSEQQVGVPEGVTEGTGVKRSKKHGLVCCGGPGLLEDVERSVCGDYSTEGTGHPQQAAATGAGVSSSGVARGGESGQLGEDGSRPGGAAAADGVAATTLSRGQSPCSPGKLLGNLLGGRTSPGGKKEGVDRRGHGALVKKILGAVQKAGGSREVGRKEEEEGEEVGGGADQVINEYFSLECAGYSQTRIPVHL